MSAAKPSPVGRPGVPDVAYHVSDHLKHRHPYSHERGFAAQKKREQGKVFNGLQPLGLDRLLENVGDSSLEPTQKAIALKHILAHSAAAESKILLLRKGAVPLLAALILSKPIPAVEQASAQVLRSLCILPQGSHAVVAEGGLSALATMAADRRDETAREEARTHAVGAIQLVVSSWDGRAWVLGLEPPSDLELHGRDVALPTPQQQEALAQTVLGVLVDVLERDTASPRMTVAAVHALALLTSVSAGLHLALPAGALQAATSTLRRFAEADLWVYSDAPIGVETVLHGATVVWHMVLDDAGAAIAADLPLMEYLGHLLAFVLPVREALQTLKAALGGAVCAMAMHPPFKGAALDTVTAVGGEQLNVLDLVLRLLQQANEAHDPLAEAARANLPPPEAVAGMRLEDVRSVVKNAVQAVRLIVELPRARQYLKELLDGPDHALLRRQLFYRTNFQEEFQVPEV